MLKIPLCFLALFITVMTPMSACDDVIVLNNDDRISGKILTIDKGTLRIETDYAGILSITLDAVSSITTSAPRAVALEDDTVVEGIFIIDNGVSGIMVEERLHPMKASEIAALAADVDALETLLTPAPPKRWSGTVEGGLALRGGNTDTTDARFAATIKRTGERNTLKLGLNASYGAVDGAINTRRYAGDFRWQYYLRERFYLFTIGLAERDDGRKLDMRLQGGGGLGYDFIKGKKTTLSSDLGLTYTYERWAPFTPWEADRLRDEGRLVAYNRLYGALTRFGEEDAAARPTIDDLREILADIRDPLRGHAKRTEDYLNVRVGVNFSRSLFKNSTLTEELVLMPNLEQLGEFRALSELAFNTPLTEALSLRVSLKTEYDSLAREKAVKAWDNTLSTQLRYAF